MIKSNYPERTGKHFICYCNQQIPGTSDYSIAQAAIQHMDHILEVSQETLAEESHLSEASVSRFVHKCGFDTFQKFKQQVAMFLSWRGRRKFQEQLLAHHGKANADIAAQLCESAQANLRETVQNMNFSNLQVIIEQLRRAKTIYIIGDTRDIYCFYSFQLDLLCSGKTVYLYNIDNISKTMLPQMDPHTAIVLLSVHAQWYNEEMAYLCSAAKEKGTYRIIFSQDEPLEGVDSELCYRFGQEGSVNDGYHSLMILGQMLSVLFYRTDV